MNSLSRYAVWRYLNRDFGVDFQIVAANVILITFQRSRKDVEIQGKRYGRGGLEVAGAEEAAPEEAEEEGARAILAV